MATYANYLTHKILLEAGVPGSVIQFVPGDAPSLVKQCTDHADFAGLHFTGSTHVFKGLWKQISNNVDIYKSYPRIVGETGGKNFHMIHKSANLKETVIQSIRSAFEYSGQKCSALSRAYVPRSMWEAGWGEVMKTEVEKITVGGCEDFKNFVGPVINQASFDKITGLIAQAKEAGGEIVVGGTADSSKGYFVNPTVILTKDPKSVTMVQEIFGPVLTVFVYEDDDFEKTLELVDGTTSYALTGSIFAADRSAVLLAQKKLRNAAGNYYINDKCTGAVVGQQPFGGARASGTNDKSGSSSIFYRFVSARSIKETFVGPTDFVYPSNFD
jgi:1-pyrroline-5-carboxylate dehydrogenase